MSVEIVSIGTELLNGLGRNTNADRIIDALSDLGIPVDYITTVGDDSARLGEALRTAVHRVPIVITTGGLGPTPDDLTRKTIATVFRRRLVLDETVLALIRGRFRERGIEMPAMNEGQALVPRGAQVIENTRGTAPGLHFAHLHAEVFVLPGVPAECETMLANYVVPRLKGLGLGQLTGRRIVRTVGLSESLLAERLAGLEREGIPLRVGYLPHSNGLDVTLSASGGDAAWIEEALDHAERRVVEAAGAAVFGFGRQTMAEVVGAALAERGLTLAVAESFTAGGMGSAVTSVPGSSRYFLGGVTAYSNRAKQDLLGVEAATLERVGAVSPEVAEQMASGARARFGADLALSSTGVAGPDGGSAEKPVGLCYLGIASAEGARSVRYVLGGTRPEITARAVAYALDLLRRHLQGGVRP
ncbi:MAG TPA: competence/damage-inducible protein A [Candidatus Eisenbacteria bacterium]|nr:competence/damage-inducible protein A [Candidatus Eisenbacteria bacterium]